MKTGISITLFWVLGSICFAEVPPAKILEQILEEQSDSIYNFQGKFSMDGTITYDLNKEQRERILNLYDTQFEITIEKGKIYSLVSSVDQTRPHNIFRQSWNGEVGYRSSENPRGARNDVTSKLEMGTHAGVMMYLDQNGLMANKILGTYDIKAGSQNAKTDSPLMVFERIRETGAKTKETILLEEIEYNGKPHLKMSLVSRLKNPLAEHIMDPELNYACVRSNLYFPEGGFLKTEGGLLRTIVRDYQLDEGGQLLLKKSTMTEMVRTYSALSVSNKKLPYPKADLDKVASIQVLTFEEYKINQPISPSVYEQENVFVLGAETWDDDRGIMIEQSLDEIANETLLQLNQFADNDIQQQESSPVAKTDNQSNATVEKETESPSLQEPEVTKNSDVPDNDISRQAKQTNKLNGLWLAVAIGGIVVFIFVLRLKIKPSDRSTNRFLLIILSLLLANSCSRAANASPPNSVNINLGVMDIHTKSRVYEYKLMNPLKEPLKIINVKTSCSCTVAQFPDIIGPGKTKPVRITVLSEKRIGKIATSVALFTDKFPDPIMIYLTAYKQNATITQNVMFTDVDVAEKLTNSKIQLTRAIVVNVFDNQTKDVGLANLVYDPNAFIVTPYGSSVKSYQVEYNGVNWRYISKVFAVQIKPKGLGVGNYRKKIRLQNLPIQNIKSPESKNIISSLFTTATGRVFDKLYTSPSSLTFLVSNGKLLNKKKRFVVFLDNNLDYDIVYNTNTFQLISNPSGRYELSLLNDYVEKIQNKTTTNEFIRFSYLDKIEGRKEYKLPVKIVSY